MDIRRALAKALKTTRKYRCLTQEDFAVVSSRTYLSTLERGLKSPTLEKIHALAEQMDIHPLTLLTLTYMNAMGETTPEMLFEKIEKEVFSIIHQAAS